MFTNFEADWTNPKTYSKLGHAADDLLLFNLLLRNGADVNARNDHGESPLDETDHAGRSIDVEPVRRLLLAHGARRSTM